MKHTWLLLPLLPIGFATSAQLPNAKTETFRIAGNCEMCKQTIEHAGTTKGESTLAWNADTHIAELTYDATATSADAVLKRVAYAGYDNDRYLAPAEAYAALKKCCQYERVPQAAAVADNEVPITAGHGVSHAEHEPAATTGQPSPLDSILPAYFNLKEALVAGNTGDATTAATLLSKQLNKLSASGAKQVATQATAVAEATALADQRTRFAPLSEGLYQLVKRNPTTSLVYYQHCPMYNQGKGGNWLSKEKAIRNPYYGEQMLGCGNVVETVGKKKTETHVHE